MTFYCAVTKNGSKFGSRSENQYTVVKYNLTSEKSKNYNKLESTCSATDFVNVRIMISDFKRIPKIG